MSITNLKVMYLYDPEAARHRVIEAFSECNGSMKATAAALGCHYATLLRVIKYDAQLSRNILSERLRLSSVGVQQRGFGPYQRAQIEQSA